MTTGRAVSTVGRVRPPTVRSLLRGSGTGDVALAAVLTVLAVLDVALSPDWRGPTAVNLALVPLMPASLLWRRRLPFLPVAVVTAVFLVLGIAYSSSQTWTGIFVAAVAVYSAAAHTTHLWPVAAWSAAGALAHVTFDPEVHSFGDAIWTSTLTGLAFLAGLTGRRLGSRSEALDTLAAQLEREDTERAAAAVAEERRRIARELHDIISHSLGVLVLQAGAAEQALDRHPEQVREVLQSMRRTGQDAIAEMTTLLGLIRTDPDNARTPQPSLRDLDTLVTRTQAAGLPVELEVTPLARPISAAVELSVYRVVQEALTNVLKHAPGAPTRVSLQELERAIEVAVVNEAPPRPPARAPGSRRGLAGLAERVAVFGGRLHAGPRSDGGWVVQASFPVAL